jgi:transketolase
MAIAERWLAAHFNVDPGEPLIDYKVYTFCGDGDMMEGISSEAASVAGHLGLSNLIWFYDNNRITIEGSTDLAFSEDVALRFMGYHWNVLRVSDANDLASIERAIKTAQAEKTRPTMVIVDSHIAWGAPKKQDTAGAHGEPLGDDEIKATKKFYGWPEDAQFLIPQEAAAKMGEAVARGAKWEAEWNAKFAKYKAANPELAKQFEAMEKRELPEGWDAKIPTFPPDAKGIASRESSGKVENAVAAAVPWLLGGSADLAPSTKTLISGEKDFEKGSYGGRNFHFGIREHGMGGILNGMSLSRLRPYGAGFLIFTDYMRGAMRLSAIMDQPVIYIFTHDSIGLGEDGPTHQPIEHLMSLRAMPRMIDMRPADANEVAESWRFVMHEKDRPVCLILSRQALPTFDRTKYGAASGLHKGAYIMGDCEGTPEVILVGTGSEVQLCVSAYEQLKGEGVKARVVSMPSWKVFVQQPKEYQESVFPAKVRARVAVEAGTTLGWREIVGLDGRVVARADFGASAPIKDLMKHFGFTVENVVKEAREAMKQSGAAAKA